MFCLFFCFRSYPERIEEYIPIFYKIHFRRMMCSSYVNYKPAYNLHWPDDCIKSKELLSMTVSKNILFSKNVPSGSTSLLNPQKIWSDHTFEQTSAIYFDACFKSVVILICFPQSVRLYYRPRTNEANPGPSLQRWRVQLLLWSVKYRLVLELYLHHVNIFLCVSAIE